MSCRDRPSRSSHTESMTGFAPLISIAFSMLVNCSLLPQKTPRTLTAEYRIILATSENRLYQQLWGQYE